MTAAARPIGGPALDAALPLPHGIASLAVSSRLVDDPADGTEALLDDDPTTGWIAARVDPRPAITISLDGRRSVSGIQLTGSTGLPAAAPTRLVIRSGHRSSTATVDPNGVVSLPSTITGRRFVLTFPTRADRTDTVGAQLPVGIGGLQLDFANGRATEPVPATARFVERCGSGPALSIDGAVQQTSVGGTLSDVMHDGELTVHPCLVAGRQITLGAGTHQVSLLRTATVRPDSLVIRPAGLARPTTGPTRAVRILTWHSDTRRVSVAAGAASWLSLQENENAGWQATLNGHRLPSTIVDGWKQAFLVPAGAGGVVSIDFAPDRAFHIGLLAGAVAVLILLALAGFRSAPRPIRLRQRPRRWGPRLLIAAGLLAVPAMVGIAGAIAVPALAVITWLVARRLPRAASLLLRTVAVAGVVLAGVLAAWHPYGQLASLVADGRVAQWCCALSIAAVALSLLVPPPPDRAPVHPDAEPADA
jgi:arabinofuranan 3-O-arabinosyltransferase